MFSRNSAAFFLFALLLVSCGRPPQSEARRIAVLQFYNQTSDPALDWIGRALSGMIAAQAAGDSKTYWFEAGTERDAWLARATHTVEGAFSLEGGKLRAVAYLRNGVTNQQMLVASSTAAEAPTSIADTFTKQLAKTANGFDTQDREAIRLFYTGAGSSNLAGLLAGAEAAVRKDPKFGKAQLVLMEALIASGRKEEASVALQDAKRANLSSLDRARLQLVEANFSGDAQAQAAASERLASLTGDTVLWRSMATRQLTAKDYKAAALSLESALALEGENLQMWNTLAYARAFEGNLGAAEKAIAEYRRIAPDDANALDTMGEIYFVHGKYADAERLFLEAFDKNKTLIGGADAYRAALSALMRGDPAKADASFARFIDYRKSVGDPLVQVRQAIWLHQSGRAVEAMSQLKRLNAEQGIAGAAAGSQIAAILAFSGRFTEAQDIFSKPTSEAVVAGAVRSPTMPVNSATASAWWLLFRGRYKEAADLWGKLYDSLNGVSASEARVGLAWSLLETGQKEKAKALLTLSPEPPVGANPGFPSLILSKWQELRSRTQ